MLYKTLPVDWMNWDSILVKYEDYAKIVKPDPPLTKEEKIDDAASALLEYAYWKRQIPEKYISLAQEIKPEEFKQVKRLEVKANHIKSNELRRMVLSQAGDMLANIIGCPKPLL